MAQKLNSNIKFIRITKLEDYQQYAEDLYKLTQKYVAKTKAWNNAEDLLMEFTTNLQNPLFYLFITSNRKGFFTAEIKLDISNGCVMIKDVFVPNLKLLGEIDRLTTQLAKKHFVNEVRFFTMRNAQSMQRLMRKIGAELIGHVFKKEIK